MKKLIPYISILIVILCVTNLVCLYFVHAEIKDLKADIHSVAVSVDRITEAPKINDELQVEDPFHPSPNNLQDILNRIDVAEENIRTDIQFRNR